MRACGVVVASALVASWLAFAAAVGRPMPVRTMASSTARSDWEKQDFSKGTHRIARTTAPDVDYRSGRVQIMRTAAQHAAFSAFSPMLCHDPIDSGKPRPALRHRGVSGGMRGLRATESSPHLAYSKCPGAAVAVNR
ncbi:hypothetical protein D3C81_1498020 [compost metagenome]